MAGASLLMLLDDIASVLDDVALMTKAATKKTAGILGDDLALNAQQVSGVVAERELPVVWAVAKGSLLNKVILVPAALVISTFAPWLVVPLLMIGGAYLCFEGAEKILHKLLEHSRNKSEETPAADAAEESQAAATPVTEKTPVASQAVGAESALIKDAVVAASPDLDPALLEKEKIKGAVRTDFVLSAEIIVIALGAVPDGASFGLRAAVLGSVGLLMTIGVYGLVAAIVKLDDAGLFLISRNPKGRPARKLGEFLVSASPRLMRLLTIAGTLAMFMVGGGILVHGFPFLHPFTEQLNRLPFPGLTSSLANAFAGLLAGVFLFLPVHGVKKLLRRKSG